MLQERASGILLHPTSIPTRFGIGDLGPRAWELIDWLAGAEQSYWQVLPLCPTDMGDSPYQSPSSFAGNPLLISPDLLAADCLLSDADLSTAALPEIEFSPRVDFQKAAARKYQLLDIAISNLRKRPSSDPLQHEFAAFCDQHRDWVENHAKFMAQRDANQNRPWQKWTESVSEPGFAVKPELGERFVAALILQFFFVRQWQQLRNHAAERGIRIIGDIPIYVSLDSVDVWANRALFQLNEQGDPTRVAGVPPDYFAATGQLWNNPLYDWDAMERDGFRWWIHRLEAVLQFVDLVRLDHFRGFESYWSVPAGEMTAMNGEWVPGPRGKLLQALCSAKSAGSAMSGTVPIIAEDLGMITEEVHALRKEFHLPGMKVLQFLLPGEAWDNTRPEDFESKLLNNKTFEPLVRLTSNGIDWFEFDAVYRIEGVDEVISHAHIKGLVQQGQNFISLRRGEILPIPRELYDQIEGMSEDFDTKKLHLAQMPFVMEQIRRFGLKSSVDERVMAIYEELKRFQSIETTIIPGALSGVLRDYQKKGVDWLAFLRKFNFGGVLADEMGLGKTLQALTMLQKEIEAGNRLPSLVVCPTTLVWNWQEEIKKFLPHVEVLVLIGNHRRDLFDQIKKSQVVITSYSLLRRDIELYKKFVFNYVLLDEAQNIKNRNTRNAQVAKSLNASMRLAMTGTPVENSIMDLWSIFDFLMPGFLGGAEKFKRRYEIPITKLQDKEQLAKLSSMILPFVLRRLKKDVIKDLPEKIEQVSYCELEPTQAKIYGKMIESARMIATRKVGESGFEKNRMVILTLILRLRQICCHPLIAGVDLGHRSVSGKMELLKETLEELLAGGHKVLIFSQFVSMLKLMEEYLSREKIPYAYMDGSSKERQQEVERFNGDPALKVFLLSLKVGGVGLNLTSADTVIIYEPWWNPAVENQAIDRVHRIGQSNFVLAYRLITKGTIEEKMIELQNRKRFLMDNLVLSEDSIGKKLDWEDIKFLLDIK